MSSVTIYRITLFIRGCWSVIEWFFGWVHPRTSSHLSQISPYLPLFTAALGETLFLALLAGLWFFFRWARWAFAALIGLAVIAQAFRAYHWASVPPAFVIAIVWFMVVLDGVIVAMSFLPPVRDHFTDRDLTIS